MNIVQLKTFVTVVESGSFSEAARRMKLSQPAVTMQMQSLEADVGATLLDRRYRKIDLTEAGAALLPHARKVLAELDSARDELSSLSGTITGRLTIAASTTPGVYVVPRLLGTFLADNPEVRVTIVVHDTAEVVSAVESGRANVGIVGALVRGAKAEFGEAGVDELICLCHPDSALATRTAVPVAELAEQTWIMRESGSGTRQVTERVLADAGLDPEELRIAVELGTGEAIVGAIEGGLGVSVVSRHVAEKALALGTVARVDVAGFPVTRPFFTVLPKGTPTRAALAFAEAFSAARLG